MLKVARFLVYYHTQTTRLKGLRFRLVSAQHMVSSLLGLIDWWINQKQPYSIDQMATIYERLIIQATWHALGKDNPMSLPW